MKQEDFNLVMSDLQDHIDACETHFTKIRKQGDLDNLTAVELRELKTFCDEEVVKQTDSLMVDVYHIIGMGNLSAVQLMQFVSKVSEYSKYRPNIKAVHNKVMDVFNLPKIPTSTEYEVKYLGHGLKLHGGMVSEAVEVDDESVNTHTQIHTEANLKKAEENSAMLDEVPFKYDGASRIEFQKSDAVKVAEYIVSKLKCCAAYSKGDFANTLIGTKKKYGFVPAGCIDTDSNTYRVVINTQGLRNVFQQTFRKTL